MRLFFLFACVLVLSVLPALPSRAADERQYVVVTPDPKSMSIDDRKVVLHGVGLVMVEAEAGTPVCVLDGKNQRVIAQFEIPGGSEQARMHKLKGVIQSLRQAFTGKDPPDDKRSLTVDMPTLAFESLPHLHDNGEDTRVLLYATLDDVLSEPMGDKKPTAEDIIALKPDQHPYGMNGRAVKLKDASFFWVRMGVNGKSTKTFYTNWLGANGASLSGTALDVSLMKEALFGDKPKPFSKKVDITQQVAHTAAVQILVDGSGSMGEALAQSRDLSLSLAKLGADLTPGFTLSVTVHRGTDHFSRFGPEPIAPGTSSEGMKKLRRFIEERSVAIHYLRNHDGEATGKTGHATPFEPVVTPIDIEQALTMAMEDLARVKATRKVLLIIGDAAISEHDGKPGSTSAKDRSCGERLLRAVGTHLDRHHDLRVVVLNPSAKSVAEDRAFFRDLVKRAGDRGRYDDGLDKMEDLMHRALLGA
jgi:hypothetical protein